MMMTHSSRRRSSFIQSPFSFFFFFSSFFQKKKCFLLPSPLPLRRGLIVLVVVVVLLVLGVVFRQPLKGTFRHWQNLRILAHPLSSHIPSEQPSLKQQQHSSFRLRNVTIQLWNWVGAPLERHWVGFGGDRLQLPNYLGAEVEKQCEIGCHFVGGKTGVEKADGVILEPPLPHYEPWPQEGVSLPPKRPHQKWLVLSYETLIYFPVGGRQELQRIVDYNMTYEQTGELPITLTCSWGGGTIEDFLRPPPTKPRNVAPVVFMASNCGAGGALERKAYVEELMKYVRVDSYGNCLHNKDLPESMRQPIYDDHGSSMKNKIKIFSWYKFALTFENNNVTDYVTEKYVNALQAGTVPVYMGAPNIDSWVPGERAIIKTSDFAGPRELGMYLNALAKEEEEYMKFFEWKKKGLLPQFVEKYNRCVFYGAECRLCRLLSENSVKEELTTSSTSPFVVPLKELESIPRALMFSTRKRNNNTVSSAVSSTTYIQIEHNPVFHTLRKALTISVWALPSYIVGKDADDVYVEEEFRLLEKQKSPVSREQSEEFGLRFGLISIGGLRYIQFCNDDECHLSQRALHISVWQHIAVTLSFEKDGEHTTQMKMKGGLWINGKLDSTFTLASELSSNSHPFRIGSGLKEGEEEGGSDGRKQEKGMTGCCQWVGGVDDLSIWNRALTEVELQRLMFLRLLGNETGLVAYYLFDLEDLHARRLVVRDSSQYRNDGVIIGFDYSFSWSQEKPLRFLPLG